MPETERDIALFRTRYPHVVSYLEAHRDSWRASNEILQDEGTVLEGTIEVIENEILSETVVGQPAQEWHARWIPNGDYTVFVFGEEVFLRIHLVRSGTLRGKRIVKVRRQNGQYAGFGFVTQDGQFSLWRRFQREAGLAHEAGAQLLLDFLTDDRSPHELPTVVVGHGFGGATWTATCTQLRCFHCNAMATYTNAFAFCHDHGYIPPFETPAEETPTYPTYSTTANFAVSDITISTPEEAIPVPPSRGRRRATPSNVLMSQINEQYVR